MMNPCRAWESGGGEGRDRMARVGEDQVTFLQYIQIRLSPHCVPTITSLCLDFNLTVPYFQHIVTPLSLHFHPRNPLDPFTKWINFFKCVVLGVIEITNFWLCVIYVCYEFC